MTYDKDYFIKKFEAIPDDEWHIGWYIDDENPQKKCALGHCGCDIGHSTTESIEFNKLIDIIGNAADINDNSLNRYFHFGSTPKQRILHALRLLP